MPSASIHSWARLIVLRFTRCNIVILMAAAAWLMLSFSYCIVCGLDSFTVLFKRPHRLWGWGRREKCSLGTPERYGIRIKSAHDTGTEGQHQPRSCSHQNLYVTSGIPQHGDNKTVDYNCSNTLRNINTNTREKTTRTRAKWMAGYFFVAHCVLYIST